MYIIYITDNLCNRSKNPIEIHNLLYNDFIILLCITVHNLIDLTRHGSTRGYRGSNIKNFSILKLKMTNEFKHCTVI